MATSTSDLLLPPFLPPFRLKLLLFGPANTGKSCIIKRLAEDKFISRYVPTIGVDYGVLRPDIEEAIPVSKLALLNKTSSSSASVRCNIFDMGGDSAYKDVRNEFYRDMHGAVLVFSLSDRSSFEALDSFWAEAEASNLLSSSSSTTTTTTTTTTPATPSGGRSNPCALLLCGSKSDESRAVSQEEAKTWASAHGIEEYMEVSSSLKTGVSELYAKLVELAVENL